MIDYTDRIALSKDEIRKIAYDALDMTVTSAVSVSKTTDETLTRLQLITTGIKFMADAVMDYMDEMIKVMKGETDEG